MKKSIFNKQYFADLAKEFHLNAEDFMWMSNDDHHHAEIVLGEELQQQLVEVQKRFEQLAVMGDDELRVFFFEIPRPTPEEWGDCDDMIESGEVSSREGFLREWHLYHPTETRWLRVGSAIYREFRSLHFTDRKQIHFIIANRASSHRPGFTNDWRYEENLKKLFPYLHKLLDDIVADPDGFNEYVAANLPHQQRFGRIPRKVLNRIEPQLKIEVEDMQTAIKALEDSVNGVYAAPFETMTIRLYCKYYRVAHEAYERYHQRYDDKCRLRRIPKNVPEEYRDIAYYKRACLQHLDESLDVDSPEDYKKFADDHYGELGLSRLNVYASNFERPGWRIIVSNSYSACVDMAIEVATALYKTGAPLEIHDAEKLLKILREEDYVRLMPYTFHDYMNRHEEGTVFELPWEYWCDDEDSFLTKEQCREIIAAAEWEEIEKVKLNNPK